VFLFYIFFVIIGFGLVFAVLEPVLTNTASLIHTTGLDNPISTQAFLNYQAARSFIITSFYILTSLVIMLSWVTSFVDRNNLFSYLINVIGSLILTPLLIYFVATWWADFSVLSLDLSVIRDDFITNWGVVMTVNFFFGLISFLFVRKGATQ
jgi:hypothetical protein